MRFLLIAIAFMLVLSAYQIMKMASHGMKHPEERVNFKKLDFWLWLFFGTIFFEYVVIGFLHYHHTK